MRILMVNKYLYHKGGAETYLIKLGKYLESMGHEVQYFGMADERNIVGNSRGAYADNIDFHKTSVNQLTYPFRIIYSRKAANKICEVIEDFRPDIVHLNNFNYQLTPSIIYEIKKHNIPIVYTAHDVQLVCPNHKLKNERTEGLCRECYGGKYHSCIRNNCIHSSKLRSIIGAAEGWFYRKKHTYRMIDAVVCPSEFMEKELLHNMDLAGRTQVLYNFIDEI
ncbi:MAG: glycosyltransferase, partial [Hominilimicola sp.]